jgi:phosphoribosylaminoimidazole carboxylase PurE protein
VIKPKVAVVIGSSSDYPVLQNMIRLLEDFAIPFELTVSSAHRSPDRTHRYAVTLEERGIQVVIACAGAAAHLAGVLAAHTILPVIGVPINSSPLQGFDALLSTAMMPPGVPVATMGVGELGASNAAVLAALADRLREYKEKLAEGVEESDRELKKSRNV